MSVLTCATRMLVQKEIVPSGWTAWSFERMRPVSGVKVVRTSQLLHQTERCVISYYMQTTPLSDRSYTYDIKYNTDILTLPLWLDPHCSLGYYGSLSGRQCWQHPAVPATWWAGNLHSSCIHCCLYCKNKWRRSACFHPTYTSIIA